MKLCIAFALVALSFCEASVLYPKRTAQFNRIRLNKESFIVGGTETTIAEYPHQLILLDLTRGGFVCGASNISPRHALSAAHCLARPLPPNFINLLGGTTSRLTGGHIFFVERYVNHPLYNTRTLDNDISIFFVDENTPMSGFPHVSSIPIPPSCATSCCGVCSGGSDVTVTGWGIYNLVTRQFPENLQRLVKPIVELAECDRIWGGIQEDKFCTLVENGRDICLRDSGSPIVRNGVQVGIVSFGFEVCVDGSVPAVHVRLEAPIIRNFIAEQTGL